MQVTLGGDRLGSGKKNKVSLHGYQRSTHDIGYLWRSTMSAGTLVPFMSELALPGDTFDIDLDSDIKTHPTIGPLFGSYKAQYDIFLCPIRLYNAFLHNNALNIGRNMSAIKLPLIELTAPQQDLPMEEGFDLTNSQINPSCLLAYIGIRGVGFNEDDSDGAQRTFNAIPIIAYWDIYKNYYANKQEEIGAVIHTPGALQVQTIDQIQIDGATLPTPPAANGSNQMVEFSEIAIDYTGASPFNTLDQVLIAMTPGGQQPVTSLFTGLVDDGVSQITGFYDFGTWGNRTAVRWTYASAQEAIQQPIQVSTFPLVNLDEMRNEILLSQGPNAFGINSLALIPYLWLYEQDANNKAFALNSQEGLAVKTYQSDLFNNWISTEWLDGAGGITEITSIDTTGGSFSLDTLILSRKVYDMLNRIAVSDGTYDAWVTTVYDHEYYRRCTTPMYMGGLIKELVFQEVVSNSGASGVEGSQPLGTLAGRGILSRKHKGGHITVKVDEPSYIIGIVSLTPRIDYSQGNKWDVQLKTMDDLHKPALDQIGFQELITEQMAWWDTTYNDTTNLWETKSAGKQPAWINYMTNINRTYGNFAIETNEMFMTLNRRYEYDLDTGEIDDLTTYIDPSKYNFIFAQTALDAQNFWVQIAVDITARRKMSAKIMPNL